MLSKDSNLIILFPLIINNMSFIRNQELPLIKKEMQVGAKILGDCKNVLKES